MCTMSLCTIEWSSTEKKYLCTIGYVLNFLYINVCTIAMCTITLCTIRLCTIKLCTIKSCTISMCTINLCTKKLCTINLCTKKLCTIRLCTIISRPSWASPFVYKNFGTITSRRYWEAATLEHGLAKREVNAWAWIRRKQYYWERHYWGVDRMPARVRVHVNVTSYIMLDSLREPD